MPDTGPDQAFGALIHHALRDYHADAVLSALPALAELRVVQAQLRRAPGRVAAAVRAVLDAGLARLAERDDAAADLLVQRFVAEEPLPRLLGRYHYAERTFFSRQKKAVAALTGIIWAAEETLRGMALTEAQQRVLNGLPPPTFSRLFGVTGRLHELKELLRNGEACWLIAVDGMGGIGKTALARAAVETLVAAGRFERVAWITAQQQSFAWGRLQPAETPVLTYATCLGELARLLGVDLQGAPSEGAQEQRLRLALTASATLIVVDNLETAADMAALVAGLHRLARPAKVMLTTRQRVLYEPVTVFTLSALPPDDALAFIGYHAAERNIPAARGAPATDLARIVHVTDGNPLAIKLVIGQLASLPLAQVLADLTAARPAVYDFYQFIFRYSWDHLTKPAQDLLLHMPLFDVRGVMWEDLAAVNGGDENGACHRALTELVNASLVNAGYVAGQLVYSIHRLTEYFILSDLVHNGWGDPAK
jgi:hypothetical protein